jgi:hypothetical protein
MASNNLAVGAQALLLHGADPSDASNPVKVAKQSEAAAVASALAAHGSKRRADRRVSRLTVFSEVRPEVAGDYAVRRFDVEKTKWRRGGLVVQACSQ